MPKTIRGICPDMTCTEVRLALEAQKEKIKKENEERNKANEGLVKSKQKNLLKEVTSVSRASEVVAEKLGIPKATVRTIYRRNILKVGSGEPTPKEIIPIKLIETMGITGGNGNDVDFELKMIDGVKYLTAQENKYGSSGAKIPTANHFNFTMELLEQFKEYFATGLNIEELKAMEPPVIKKAMKK